MENVSMSTEWAKKCKGAFTPINEKTLSPGD